MAVGKRTMKRWGPINGAVVKDRRSEAEQVKQPHKLTKAKEVAILIACNLPE
jgi:hypothetical protein